MPDATTAHRIERARRCLAEGRGVLAGDLAALLDRVEQLERQVAQVRQKQSKGDRNAVVLELADVVCPNLSPRPAARKLLHVLRERSTLPAAVATALDRLDSLGGLQLTDRQVANIIREARMRNEQEI